MLRNVPIPEASLVGIGVGVVLERVRPWRLPGTARVRRVAGCGIVAAGSCIIGWALSAASATELARPDGLVTGGPYALSRNPMYVGWTLVHLGVGVTRGSAWMLATLPAAGVALHREVLREERRLEDDFGDEYRQYEATVARYLPKY